jgi:hypothetical protein
MYQITEFLVAASGAGEAISGAESQVKKLMVNSDFDYFHFNCKDGSPAVSAEDSLFWKRLRAALKATATEMIAHRRLMNSERSGSSAYHTYRWAQLREGFFAFGNHFFHLDDWGPFSRQIKKEVLGNPGAWWLVSMSLHH